MYFLKPNDNFQKMELPPRKQLYIENILNNTDTKDKTKQMKLILVREGHNMQHVHRLIK